jgi:hypothetical protein
MITPSQPPNDILQRFINIGHTLRRASRARDYITLCRLLGQHLDPQGVDVMVYIRTPAGTLTLVGSHADLWLEETGPMALSREPSREDLARLHYQARRTP